MKQVDTWGGDGKRSCTGKGEVEKAQEVKRKWRDRVQRDRLSPPVKYEKRDNARMLSSSTVVRTPLRSIGESCRLVAERECVRSLACSIRRNVCSEATCLYTVSQKTSHL